MCVRAFAATVHHYVVVKSIALKLFVFLLASSRDGQAPPDAYREPNPAVIDTFVAPSVVEAPSGVAKSSGARASTCSHGRTLLGPEEPCDVTRVRSLANGSM